MILTKATIRNRAATEILGGPGSTAEQNLINDWIDEAVEQYLAETKNRVREGVMALTAGETDYQLPAEILSLSQLWILPTATSNAGAETQELTQISSSDMLRRRRWGSSWARTYQMLGDDMLRIDPAPAAGDELHILYVPAPAAPLADTESPALYGVPSNDHPVIEAYVKWKLAQWDDDTSSAVGDKYMAQWLAGVREAKMKRNRADNGWGPARPGRGWRAYIPPRNGFDLG